MGKDAPLSPHPGFVREYMTTCIFPDLVMKLVKNNFIVCNVIVSKNVLSLWARRVHIWVWKPRGKKRKGERGMEGRAEWWHQSSFEGREASTRNMVSRPKRVAPGTQGTNLDYCLADRTCDSPSGPHMTNQVPKADMLLNWFGA